MESSQVESLVRGIFLLDTELSRPGSSPPELKAWLEAVASYLTVERIAANAERTQMILKSELIKRPEIGESLLDALLNVPLRELPQRTRVAVELARTNLVGAIVADNLRRPRLYERLRAAEPEFLDRVFPLLADFETLAATELVLDQWVVAGAVASGADAARVETALRILNRYFVLELKDLAAWQAWWRANRDRPLLRDIATRREQRDNERVLAYWRRLTEQLSDSQEIVVLLRTSLEPTNNLPVVRSEAVKFAGTFAYSLHARGDSNGATNRQALLEPLHRRLLEIATDANESYSLRSAAVESLGQMKDFGSNPELLALMSQLLRNLETAPLASLAHALGLAAVGTIGRLEAPLGVELVETLRRVLPTGDEAEWEQVSAELVKELLGALKEVGLPDSPQAVALLADLYRELPTVGLDVMQVLSSVPSAFAIESKRQILAFFAQVLAAPATEHREIAISGIGNLRLVEGIAPLRALILGSAINERERLISMDRLADIGGVAAIAAFKDVFAQIGNAELASQARERAIRLCARDESLQLLVALVYSDVELKSHESWVRVVLGDARIAPLIDPKARGQEPAYFERLSQLLATNYAVWDAELRLRERNIVDLAAERREYERLESEARACLQAAAPSSAPDRELMETVARRAGLRARIAGQMLNGELQDCLTQFDLLVGGDVEASAEHTLWFLKCLARISWTPAAKAVLGSIERRVNERKLALDADGQAILGELLRREPSASEVQAVPPSPPNQPGAPNESPSQSRHSDSAHAG
ncbi:MAG: hypothetical protein ACKVX7_17055 [Planctomycetota bacterium]